MANNDKTQNTSGFSDEFIESLTEYEIGRMDMQNEIISRLADYKADECAQVAASIPIIKQ